jgi:uncharacterized protein (TIGR04255 family)
MTGSTLLPRFQHPPVDEVAIGVQFRPLNFLPTHYGALHDLVKSAFPVVQSLPPLNPLFENFEPEVPSGIAAFLPIVPQNWSRVLFVSEDDSKLIQVQPDRLYFNWRQRVGVAEYPHYESLRKSFAEAYQTLQRFAETNALGDIDVNQADILYINPLVTGADPDSPQKIEELLRVWHPTFGQEWDQPLDDLAFNIRYRLLGESGLPIGRLHSAFSSMRQSNGGLMMRLEMTARGRPEGDDLASVQRFHDLGRDGIVRCFTSITSEAAHKRWGRYQ